MKSLIPVFLSALSAVACVAETEAVGQVEQPFTPAVIDISIPTPSAPGITSATYWAAFSRCEDVPPLGLGDGYGAATFLDGQCYVVQLSILNTNDPTGGNVRKAWNLTSDGNPSGARLRLPCAMEATQYTFPPLTRVKTGPVPNGPYLDWVKTLQRRTAHTDGAMAIFSHAPWQPLLPGGEWHMNYTLGLLRATLSIRSLVAPVDAEEGALVDPANEQTGGVGSHFALRHVAGGCQVNGAALDFHAVDPDSVGTGQIRRGFRAVSYGRTEKPVSVLQGMSLTEIPVEVEPLDMSIYAPSSLGAQVDGGVTTFCPPGVTC